MSLKSIKHLVVRIMGVLFFLLLTTFYILPTSVFAANEFSSTYNISYEVDPTGVTTVSEKITLKNLTDRFYASNFKLSISATQITEVAASDTQGPLEVKSEQQGPKTNIVVNFAQQNAGKDKEYSFNLKFKSKDFAQAQGKIWQITIPKVSSNSDLDKYQITLIVPVSFGDPTSILPEPISQVEADGKLHLSFSKDQLSNSGILANFGTNQFYKFNLNYTLDNSGFLPKTLEITLPSSNSYQQILINSVTPKPENTYFDADGNTIAQFKLDRNRKLDVKAEGLAKLFATSQSKAILSQKEQETYVSDQKYWDKNSPQISGRLNEIFQGKNPKTNFDKAKLIDSFVVRTLSYDTARIKSNDFNRLGALTILNNPIKALCQEFSDLFISLTRAAGIPSRQLIGYAYSTNPDLRPLSLQQGQILHSWVEYYDPSLGWSMADPTWENTTGGVDYFSKFDLSHLVLVTRGVSSTTPPAPNQVQVNFTEDEFKPSFETELQLWAPEQFYAGLPAKAQIRIENKGNSATDSAQLTISSSQLEVSGPSQTSFVTPNLPPQGFLEYQFDIKARSVFESQEATLALNWGDKTITRRVQIKPFFTHQLFAPIIIGVILLMFIIYILVVSFHLKFHSSIKLDSKKKS